MERQMDYIERDDERWIYHSQNGNKYHITQLLAPYECECGVDYDSYVLLDCDVHGDEPVKPIGFIYGISANDLDYFAIMEWCRKSVKDYENKLS